MFPMNRRHAWRRLIVQQGIVEGSESARAGIFGSLGGFLNACEEKQTIAWQNKLKIIRRKKLTKERKLWLSHIKNWPNLLRSSPASTTRARCRRRAFCQEVVFVLTVGIGGDAFHVFSRCLNRGKGWRSNQNGNSQIRTPLKISESESGESKTPWCSSTLSNDVFYLLSPHWWAVCLANFSSSVSSIKKSWNLKSTIPARFWHWHY
jgi:hypothetical protein